MEAQLHHDSIQLHSYALGTPEERLASLLQQHLLGLWDVLHEFGLNHFGRLVQFAAASNGGAGAGSAAGTPGTPATGLTPASAERGGGAAAPSPPQPAAQGQGRGPSTPLGTRPPSAAGSPATVEGSPATPLHGLLLPGGQAAQQHGTSSAAAAAAEQPDPMQHDWAQVELQVRRLPAMRCRGAAPPAHPAPLRSTGLPACWCAGHTPAQHVWGGHVGRVCERRTHFTTVCPLGSWLAGHPQPVAQQRAAQQGRPRTGARCPGSHDACLGLRARSQVWEQQREGGLRTAGPGDIGRRRHGAFVEHLASLPGLTVQGTSLGAAQVVWVPRVALLPVPACSRNAPINACSPGLPTCPCRALLELGPAACLARLLGALESLASLMQEGVGGALPFATQVPPLRARIIQVAAASPLLPWALKQQPAKGETEQAVEPSRAQQQEAQQSRVAGTGQTQHSGEQQDVQAGDGKPDAPAAPSQEQDAGQQPGQQQQQAATPSAPQPPASPPTKPTTQQADGPAAAIEGGSARAAALLELLQELQMGCNLSGQRRQVALVAGTTESVAVLHQLLASAEELQTAEVCLLADAKLPAPSAGPGGRLGSLSRSASLPTAGSLGRSASLGKASLGAASSGTSGDSNHAAKAGGASSARSAAGRATIEEKLSSKGEADAVDSGAKPAGDGKAAAAGPASPQPAKGAVAEGSSDGEADAGRGGPAGELTRSASATEAAVAAAWAQAAPPTRVGQLAVHLLTTAELPALEQRIAGYHSLVWCGSGLGWHTAHPRSADWHARAQRTVHLHLHADAAHNMTAGRALPRPLSLPGAGTAPGMYCMLPARSSSRRPWPHATACRPPLPPPRLRQPAGARGSASSAMCWPQPVRCWRWEKCGGWTTRSRCAVQPLPAACLPAGLWMLPGHVQATRRAVHPHGA